jgi:AcrR family transcriptional regulator
LQEREYEQIQVREVAEDAGVALGTLYRYFPSKDLLYAHALLAWSETFEGRVQARNRGATNDAERLRAALHGAVRAYERAPSFFRLLSLLEVTADAAVQEVFGTFSGRFVTMLRAVLHDTADEDAAAIAFVASSVLGGVLRGWSQHGTPIRTVYERIDQTVALIFTTPRSAG